MPINTQYNGYKEEAKKSQQVRDFFGGQTQVKSMGEKYLPKLGGQSKAEYNAYLLRGSLTPAVKPTVLAIAGAITRKPPEVKTSIQSIDSNMGGGGQSLRLFSSCIIKELLLAGGVGCLIEWDKVLGIPVAKIYPKESLINYSDDYIVLTQSYTERDKDDKYIEVTKTEYLELTFDLDGNYIQNIWRETNQGFKIIETIMPDNRGDPLTEIPFIFGTIEGLGIQQSDPLLLDLSNVNLNEYLLSTDQRHGLHWTALPTLFVFGELTDSEGKKKAIKVGAGSFNHVEDEKARVELLEFSGSGMGAIKTVLDADINTMASIGAKMLTSESGGVKSAETARIDASSETATLTTIANTVELFISTLFEIMDEWNGTTGSEYLINRDFIDIKIDPQALTAYLQTFLSGGMSLDTFLHLLFKGEVLPKGITPEDEADRIDQGGNDFDDNSIDDVMNES